MKLYTQPNCPLCEKIKGLLAEIEAEYTEIDVDELQTTGDVEAFADFIAASDGLYEVPVLVDEHGTCLRGEAAIELAELMVSSASDSGDVS